MPSTTPVSLPGRNVLFLQLYEQHAAWIYALVFNIVRDSAAAANLVHEAFWRVWNEPRLLSAPPRSADVWVRVVARKLSIDHLRSQEGQVILSHPRTFIEEQIADQQLSMSELSRIHTAIERLPPHQRTVLELAYFENMSYPDIADVVGRPLGTVKTWGRNAQFRLLTARNCKRHI